MRKREKGEKEKKKKREGEKGRRETHKIAATTYFYPQPDENSDDAILVLKI